MGRRPKALTVYPRRTHRSKTRSQIPLRRSDACREDGRRVGERHRFGAACRARGLHGTRVALSARVSAGAERGIARAEEARGPQAFGRSAAVNGVAARGEHRGVPLSGGEAREGGRSSRQRARRWPDLVGRPVASVVRADLRGGLLRKPFAPGESSGPRGERAGFAALNRTEVASYPSLQRMAGAVPAALVACGSRTPTLPWSKPRRPGSGMNGRLVRGSTSPVVLAARRAPGRAERSLRWCVQGRG